MHAFKNNFSFWQCQKMAGRLLGRYRKIDIEFLLEARHHNVTERVVLNNASQIEIQHEESKTPTSID